MMSTKFRINFLEVQWLRLCTSTARVTGLISGRGTKIPQAAGGGGVAGRWKTKTKIQVSGFL